MLVVFSTCIWRTYVFPKRCILEKSVEKKSFLKLNFKKLLFSTLCSRMHHLRDTYVCQIHVENTTNIFILQFNDFFCKILNLSSVHLWCQRWPHPKSLKTGTYNVLQVWILRNGGSWQCSNHARELKFSTQVKNHISWCSMMSRITPSSKTPVRNHRHLPSIDTLLIMLGSWNLAHK